MQIDESIENFLILKSIINDYGVGKKNLWKDTIPFHLRHIPNKNLFW
jgi:hypothetical protein